MVDFGAVPALRRTMARKQKGKRGAQQPKEANGTGRPAAAVEVVALLDDDDDDGAAAPPAQQPAAAADDEEWEDVGSDAAEEEGEDEEQPAAEDAEDAEALRLALNDSDSGKKTGAPTSRMRTDCSPDDAARMPSCSAWRESGPVVFGREWPPLA